VAIRHPAAGHVRVVAHTAAQLEPGS
jgi:hypothetical protein